LVPATLKAFKLVAKEIYFKATRALGRIAGRLEGRFIQLAIKMVSFDGICLIE
jgi:hypothetical protein